MFSKNNNNITSSVSKTVCSIVFLTWFATLVLFPTEFQAGKTQIQVSANFIEGTQAPTNVISLTSIIPTVEDDIDPSDTVFVYKVKAWDTLSKIAKETWTTVKNIQKVNNITSNTVLKVNQTIHITDTPWFIYQLKEPTNMIVFANKYDLELDSLMEANNESDPLKKYDAGWEIFIPDTTEKGIEEGLIQKDDPQTFSIYTVKPPEKKVVVIKEKKNNVITTTTTSKPSNKPTVTEQVVESDSGSYKKPHIVAEWTANPKMSNWFIRGFCTYGAAYKAQWAFPVIWPNKQYKTWNWNAIAWWANAKAQWFKLSNVPTEWAIVVIWQGWRAAYAGYGHVWVVIKVDWENHRFLMEDTNYTGLYRVTQRWIYMNDNMTSVVANSKPITTFIPVQPLPEYHRKKVEELRAANWYTP